MVAALAGSLSLQNRGRTLPLKPYHSCLTLLIPRTPDWMTSGREVKCGAGVGGDGDRVAEKFIPHDRPKIWYNIVINPAGWNFGSVLTAGFLISGVDDEAGR